jgi:hypothetical protein
VPATVVPIIHESGKPVLVVAIAETVAPDEDAPSAQTTRPETEPVTDVARVGCCVGAGIGGVAGGAANAANDVGSDNDRSVVKCMAATENRTAASDDNSAAAVHREILPRLVPGFRMVRKRISSCDGCAIEVVARSPREFPPLANANICSA